ncbi:hypothetical protein [Chryseobacterium culicis]|uniref:Uncharacterized protein n=1 Tax=Chryseobacterium culicis TaxID=680127 RepID=A0A1H6I8T1_CHRCI|nr:hypothetical protein [Chryseobacterium culicis]SEH45567.1 hypothetical protein SAMN05421593_4344 [Chryseobacterium culicis]
MKVIFLFFVLIFNTFNGQVHNDLHFCKENANTYVEIEKIPKYISKYLKKNSKNDKYLLYKQSDKLVQTSKIKFYKSQDRLLIKYFRNTSLFSNDLIIVISFLNGKVIDYYVIGNKCMNMQDINSIMKCNCESELFIFPKPI